MRLPKFRCKNKTGNWCFFTVLHGGNVNEENFDLETLSQFTGLLDKQGVEIYEGDIIYTSGYGNDIVVFKNGRFCIDGFKYPHNNINYNTAEVVGNIYENSDLLK